MNEWMKSYIAHVSSRRLFRALNIESNLARPVIIQIPTQSPGRYTAELPLRRIKLFSFQAICPVIHNYVSHLILCIFITEEFPQTFIVNKRLTDIDFLIDWMIGRLIELLIYWLAAGYSPVHHSHLYCQSSTLRSWSSPVVETPSSVHMSGDLRQLNNQIN